MRLYKARGRYTDRAETQRNRADRKKPAAKCTTQTARQFELRARLIETTIKRIRVYNASQCAASCLSSARRFYHATSMHHVMTLARQRRISKFKSVSHCLIETDCIINRSLLTADAKTNRVGGVDFSVRGNERATESAKFQHARLRTSTLSINVPK